MPSARTLNLIALIATALVLVLIRSLSERKEKIRSLGGTAGLFLIYLAGRLIQLYIPTDIWNIIGVYYKTSLLLILSLAFIRLGIWMFFELILARRRKKETADIIKQLSVAVFFILAVFIIIRHTLNINLASLITTSAILSIIIGLALQDTLANMFAGLSIQIEKPFAIGDWISFENYTGQVEEINWRTTIIKPLSNDYVIIPNTIVAKSPVTNYNRPSRLHVRKLNVDVHLKISPNKVKEALLKALRDDPDISWKREPQIRVIEYRDYRIRYEIRFFITDFSRHLHIEDRVMTRVWYYLERAGIPIPFPIQDINLRTVTPETEAGSKRACMDKIVETIRQVDFLSPLSEDESAKLSRHVNLYTAHKDEIIIRQGDPGDSCFIIHSGLAEVSISTSAGEKTVDTLGSGQVFGEMSLMTGDQRTATVKALTDMDIILLSKDNFSHILAANPDITKKISEILALRHLQLEEKTRESAEPLKKESLDSHTSQLMARICQFFRL